ncbi:MAG: hypothetical protein EA342_15025 [Leptolyngbya sp. LCM1.Bin17]|nr:MAG: hypothetical protein EA342_15025 [Leptolyngbya sp. LCM1.Bin17]
MAMVLVAAIALMTTACTSLPFKTTQADAVPLITIDQISEAGGPGKFSLFGQAALPDQTPVTLSVVRDLTQSANQLDAEDTRRYSILDRTTAEVTDGRWQADLSLWQVAEDGTYQETWQLISPDSVVPSETIHFLLTVDPQTFAQTVAPSLSQDFSAGSIPLFNVTPDGETYLRVSQDWQLQVPQPLHGEGTESSAIQPPAWDRAASGSTQSALTSPPEPPFSESDNLPLSSDNVLD